MSKINPKHYELEVKGHKFEVADLMEVRFAQDMHLSQALKYIMRAGRKSSSSYLECVGKCLFWCARAIHFHGGTIELPSNIPANRITLGGKQITVKRVRSKD
ncbi:MAG: hypothetical protein V3T23_04750 [Nitrososphaerales archaeon]